MTQVDPPLVWHPLTAQQADFWHEYRATAGDDQGTVIHALHLHGPGDDAALAAAIAGAVAECDVLALRLAASAGDGLPMQAVDPARRPRPRRIDLRDQPDPEAAARNWITATLATSRDLLRDPLADHALIRLGDSDWIWAARGHHMMLDAYAMSLIESRAARLYAAAVAATPPGPALRPLADYLTDEAAYLASPRASADRAAWRAIMDQAPPLALARRGAAPAPVHELDQPLPDHLGQGLMACGRALSLSWPDALTLIAAAVLIDHPALPAVNRQTPGHLTLWRAEMGRLGCVAAAVPALVVNLLPLPLTRAPGQHLPDLLRAGAAALRLQRRHARWRFERLADDLGIAPPHRPLISPLINVVPFAASDFPGLATRQEVLAAGSADGLTLTFRATPMAADLHLMIEADASLIPLDAAQRLPADLLAGIERAIVALIPG
ncbi:condensation domain-containing protein [Paracoccus sp. p3-h83]|uniref:condensation domain-containing protein n=1 Tax=Paracoccus sp. p3-h83 TaxID=3342805 RepID=UPI0035B9E7F0